jgi:hypothetical protein
MLVETQSLFGWAKKISPAKGFDPLNVQAVITAHKLTEQ